MEVASGPLFSSCLVWCLEGESTPQQEEGWYALDGRVACEQATRASPLPGLTAFIVVTLGNAVYISANERFECLLYSRLCAQHWDIKQDTAPPPSKGS